VVLGSIVEQQADEMRIHLGNRDLGGADFRWISRADVRGMTKPPDALVLEREEWGRFYGYPVAIRRGDSATMERPR
jgi:phosphate transport system permease protein